MTFYELADDCWHDLPTVRKWIAGRETVNKALEDAIWEFDPDKVVYAGYDAVLLDRVRRRNEIRDGEGFVVLTFLLTVIAGAVISWLIQRWLDHRFPKEQLDSWKQELGG